MEFSIKNTQAEKQRNDCVVVGVYEPKKLSAAAAALDQASNGYIASILKRGDMKGKLGSTLMLYNVPGTACQRVLLVGLGKERELHEKEYRQILRAAAKAIINSTVGNAVSFLTDIPVGKRDASWRVAQLVEVTLDASYRFDSLKSKPSDPYTFASMVINVPNKADIEQAEAGLQQGLALAAGMQLAKDLGNTPPNICTPTYLAEQAGELAQAYGFQLEVLEREDMVRLKMGALLGVAKGSRQPPKLIVLQHNKGPQGQKPTVLVGKGITFDAGGISIKPAADMDEMKYDMCGAASVLGTFKAIGEMDLPLNVVGVIPTCENLPDGDAVKPGDVLTSMSGQTIEVLNTDAEGRLILCDALTYAERFQPGTIVDIATLTGACVIALGHHATGLFSNNDNLARELLKAGEDTFDRAWRMPLWEDYQEQLSSNFADMANIGGRAAGSITAACFLSRFAKDVDWAHLDIAGTAWKSGKEKGSTGRPVPLLTHFLVQRAGK
ncbi:MAG TPA: leucyl aminopeptidase [Methylophilaceae bacterium]|nr:leucyl aminopeptidase [Methylophilaceae bacterium]